MIIILMNNIRVYIHICTYIHTHREREGGRETEKGRAHLNIVSFWAVCV